MKFLLLGFLFTVSSLAFGQSCEEKILKEYIELLPNHEYHRILSADATVIRVSSENEGGYGIDEIIFNPATCEILELTNVYTE